MSCVIYRASVIQNTQTYRSDLMDATACAHCAASCFASLSLPLVDTHFVEPALTGQWIIPASATQSYHLWYFIAAKYMTVLVWQGCCGGAPQPAHTDLHCLSFFGVLGLESG